MSAGSICIEHGLPGLCAVCAHVASVTGHEMSVSLRSASQSLGSAAGFSVGFACVSGNAFAPHGLFYTQRLSDWEIAWRGVSKSQFSFSSLFSWPSFLISVLSEGTGAAAFSWHRALSEQDAAAHDPRSCSRMRGLSPGAGDLFPKGPGRGEANLARGPAPEAHG